MYINGHLALPRCTHLINMKCVCSKKNCDQKNSLTSLSDFLFQLFLSKYFQCLSILLKRVPKGEADEPDNDEMTSLHWSVSYGNAEHVKLLLKAGCSVTVTDLESMFQQTLDQDV